MPPTFKKPLEYDPALAQETLAKTNHKTELARQTRRADFLADLGLADEEYDVDDDDYDEGEGEDDDEQPYLRNGSASHSQTNGAALPTYGYRDLFGKEYDKRRKQMIDVKGYERYLADLLDRSNDSLQALRNEPRLEGPGNVEAIAELQHELRMMYGEYQQVQQDRPQSGEHAGARQSANGTRSEADQQTIGELRGQLAEMRRELNARDSKLSAAQTELQRAQSRLAQLESGTSSQVALLRNAAHGEAAASGEAAAQLEHVQTTLALKEAALASALAQVDALKGKAGSTALASAEAAEQLHSLARARDEAVQAQELLQQQLAQVRAQMTAQEDSFNNRMSDILKSSETEQASAVQKQLWLLTEQHSKKVEELEAELKQKQVQLQQLRTTKDEAMASVKDLKSKVAAATADATATVRKQLQGVTAQLGELHALREGVLADLVGMQQEMFNDKAITQMARLVRDKEISSIRKAQGDLKQKLADTEQAVRDAQEEIEATQQRAEQQAQILRLEAEGQVAYFRDKWRTEFDKRRKLHNMVLELKGNIRVLCRIRPMVEKERFNAGDGDFPVRVLSEELLRIVPPDGKQEKEFEFDRVLAPDDGQEKVYDEVAPLVTSVLDGFNVTIFAYGQTGSGKTFTMEGPEGLPGVNLRALADLFRLAGDRSDDVSYSFSASVLEIYNECIYDLLGTNSGPGKDDDKLDVKQGPEGMFVAGLRVEDVSDMPEVTALINRGKGNRSTFATNMNEHSSRSHLVLSVYVVGTNKSTGATFRGKLHLIDLAGSERLSRTGAQGDRLKEAQNINKSLSALGDVIQALQQRNAHIPYRNSKLTRLLEDSLGGNAKCVMIVNVSPAGEDVPETKCSLEFASRARKVELGRAKANVSGSPGGDSATSGSPVKTPGRSTPPADTSMSRSTSNQALSSAAARKSNLGNR